MAALFRKTATRNAELDAQVEELERELSVWKGALKVAEDEKKALCNATGLSMSQVSNWMINVRVWLLIARVPLADICCCCAYRHAAASSRPRIAPRRARRRTCRTHTPGRRCSRAGGARRCPRTA